MTKSKIIEIVRTTVDMIAIKIVIQSNNMDIIKVANNMLKPNQGISTKDTNIITTQTLKIDSHKTNKECPRSC